MKIKRLEVKSIIHTAEIADDWKNNFMQFKFSEPNVVSGDMHVISTAIMWLDDYQIAIEARCESLHEIDTTNHKQLYDQICKRHENALDNHLITIKEDYPFDWTSKSYDEQFE